MVKYILITSMLSVGGQPDVSTAKFFIVDSDQDCIAKMGDIQRPAHEEGKKVYTWCVPAIEEK
ncbi:TPA: hypothetical protein ACGZ5C_003936 [Citrobacter freundii]|uniref:hypothetical protein n=1 Tax=Citrobacter freundii TaxID=546 RepID=UPI002433C9E0|nr:hypothetical protein [Citrobacter freundii]WFY90609.1 hypothetical protein NFK47_13135 [Citrobacter freundii]